MWWLDREESGAGGAAAARTPPPALARTGCGPGDGITPSRRHVLRPAQRSMTSPPRACDEEGKEETLLFFPRITFARAFPGGESVTRGRHHSSFPQEHHWGGSGASRPTHTPGWGDGHEELQSTPPNAPLPCPSSTATPVMVGVVTHGCCTPHPLHVPGACGELEPFTGKLGQRKLCPGS